MAARPSRAPGAVVPIEPGFRSCAAQPAVGKRMRTGLQFVVERARLEHGRIVAVRPNHAFAPSSKSGGREAPQKRV